MSKVKVLVNLIDGYKTFIVCASAVIMGILFVCGVVTPDQVTGYAKMVGEAIGTGFILAGAGFAALRSALNKLK